MPGPPPGQHRQRSQHPNNMNGNNYRNNGGRGNYNAGGRGGGRGGRFGGRGGGEKGEKPAPRQNGQLGAESFVISESSKIRFTRLLTKFRDEPGVNSENQTVSGDGKTSTITLPKDLTNTERKVSGARGGWP
jgi:hypothetical protein